MLWAQGLWVAGCNLLRCREHVEVACGSVQHQLTEFLYVEAVHRGLLSVFAWPGLSLMRYVLLHLGVLLQWFVPRFLQQGAQMCPQSAHPLVLATMGRAAALQLHVLKGLQTISFV